MYINVCITISGSRG